MTGITPTEEEFAALLDGWLANVRTEARRLFANGVAHEKCTQIAITIVDGRDLRRLRERQTSPILPARFGPQ
jgi:hypothetical protein